MKSMITKNFELLIAYPKNTIRYIQIRKHFLEKKIRV